MPLTIADVEPFYFPAYYEELAEALEADDDDDV